MSFTLCPLPPSPHPCLDCCSCTLVVDRLCRAAPGSFPHTPCPCLVPRALYFTLYAQVVPALMAPLLCLVTFLPFSTLFCTLPAWEEELGPALPSCLALPLPPCPLTIPVCQGQVSYLAFLGCCPASLFGVCLGHCLGTLAPATPSPYCLPACHAWLDRWLGDPRLLGWTFPCACLPCLPHSSLACRCLPAPFYPGHTCLALLRIACALPTFDLVPLPPPLALYPTPCTPPLVCYWVGFILPHLQ